MKEKKNEIVCKYKLKFRKVGNFRFNEPNRENETTPRPMAEIVDPCILDPEGFRFRLALTEEIWRGRVKSCTI